MHFVPIVRLQRRRLSGHHNSLFRQHPCHTGGCSDCATVVITYLRLRGDCNHARASQTTGPWPAAHSCSKPLISFSALLQSRISDDVADVNIPQDEPYLDTAYEKPEHRGLLSHCSPHWLSVTIPFHASQCSDVPANRPRSDDLV